MAEKRVVWRAIANFAQARREADKTADSFEDLEDAGTGVAASQEKAAKSADKETAANKRLQGAVFQTAKARKRAADETARQARVERARADAARRVEVAELRAAKAANQLSQANERLERVSKQQNATDSQRERALLNQREAILRLTDANDQLRFAKEKERETSQASTKDNDSLSRSLRGVGKGFADAAQGGRNFLTVMRLMKWPAIISAVHLLVGAISALSAGLVALVSSLGPVAGLVGAMPGMFLALAQSVGALVGAFAGVGAALKAHAALLQATEPSQVVAANEKLRQSYEALSPPARRFAETLVSLKPRLDAFRQAMQRAALPGFTDALERSGPLFDTFQSALTRTAAVFGRFARGAAELMSSGPFRRDLGRVMQTNNNALRLFLRGLLELIDAARHVAVVARPMVMWFARLWETMGKTASEAAKAGRESGGMADFFDRAMRITELLGRVLKNLWDILIGLGRAATDVGNEMWDAIDKTTKRWADWINSIAGQNEMRAWFARAKPALDAFFSLLGAIAKAFAGMSAAGEGALGNIFKQIEDRLLPSLKRMFDSFRAGFVPALIDFLSALANVFAHLGSSTGGMSSFLRVLEWFLRLVDWILSHVPGATQILTAYFLAMGAWKALRLGAFILQLGDLLKIVGLLRGAMAGSLTTGFLGGLAQLVATFRWLKVGGVGTMAALSAAFQRATGLAATLGTVLKGIGITALVAAISGVVHSFWDFNHGMDAAKEKYAELEESLRTTGGFDDLDAALAAAQARLAAAKEEGGWGDQWASDNLPTWLSDKEADAISNAQDEVDHLNNLVLKTSEDFMALAAAAGEAGVSVADIQIAKDAFGAGDSGAAFSFLESKMSEVSQNVINDMNAMSDAAKDGAQDAGDAWVSAMRRINDAIRSQARNVKAARKAYQDSLDQVSLAEEAAGDATESVTDAQEAYSDAERALADSHSEVRDAQEQLTDAREDARRTLADLRREVQRQGLEEENAQLSLLEARKALQETMRDQESTSLDRRRAVLAVTEAEHAYNDTLRENRRQRDDLNEAEKKGVEGSDQVVAARRRLRDAQEGVRDAVEALSDASEGVRDAQEDAAKAAKALTEAQRGSVRAQKQLTEALEKQEKMFKRLVAKGVIDDVKDELESLHDEGKEWMRRLADDNDTNISRIMAGYNAWKERTADTVKRIRNTMQGMKEAFGEPVGFVQNSIMKPFLRGIERVSGKFGKNINLSNALPTIAGTGKLPLMHKGGEVGRDSSGTTTLDRVRRDEQVTVLQKGEKVIPRKERGGPLDDATGSGATWPSIVKWLQKTGIPHRVTSTVRPGDPGHHGSGRAADFGGPVPSVDSPELLRINKAFSTIGHKLQELIYSGPGGKNIYAGRKHTYSASTQADHHDHVHVASLIDLMAAGLGRFAKGAGGQDGSRQLQRLMKALYQGSARASQMGLMGGVAALGALDIGSKAKKWIKELQVARAPRNVEGVKALVKQMAATYGWTGSQWDALYQLVMHESGFNPKAQNPTSTAYGLFQFLDSTWGAYGFKKSSNARKQTLAGLEYIERRYGDPLTAWAFWQSNNWYRKGGRVRGGPRGDDNIPAWLSDGEFVLNKRATQAIGPRTLERINNMSFLSSLAAPGLVKGYDQPPRGGVGPSPVYSDGVGYAHGSGTPTTVEMHVDGVSIARSVNVANGRNRILLKDRD
jgi:hypothetical protein